MTAQSAPAINRTPNWQDALNRFDPENLLFTTDPRTEEGAQRIEAIVNRVFRASDSLNPDQQARMDANEVLDRCYKRGLGVIHSQADIADTQDKFLNQLRQDPTDLSIDPLAPKDFSQLTDDGLRERADSGDTEAQYACAFRFPELAVDWLEKAAEQGSPKALLQGAYTTDTQQFFTSSYQHYWLSTCSSDELQVKLEGPLFLLERAAQQYTDLRIAERSQRVIANFVEQMRRQAEGNRPEALLCLSVCFQHGIGTVKSQVLAQRYLAKTERAQTTRALDFPSPWFIAPEA